MTTARTVLRKVSIEDAAAWKSFNNLIVKRMATEGLSWPPVPSIVYARNELLHYLQEWERGTRYVYMIVDKSTGAVVGDFHIKSIDRRRKRAEFGHALHPRLWGTGVTHETLDALKRAASRRGYLLWASVEEGNIRSWRSLENHGATFKGTRAMQTAGVRKRMRIYELR
jgi:RimJ/RimL family protein N-acetyltransferase